MKLAAVLLALLVASPASAQVDGHVSALFDVFPKIGEGADRSAELRTRLFVEHRRDVGTHVRLNLSGSFDGLAASRKDAIVRPGDLYVEFRATHFDVRAGASRLVWGRLDEFQPTDIVNPIDLTRFVLEGRSEARLPVGLVRVRAFLPKASTIEGVVVPVFRAGRFDQLDEPSSPFNLAANATTICPAVGLGPCRLLRLDRREPAAAFRNMQGGLRLTTTSGRVDWALSAWRGFRTFPVYTVSIPALLESFPRFTMVGGDFETVRGAWGVRGEVAAFAEESRDRVESGVGVDRKAGDYRIAANVLWSYQETEGSDVSLVAAVDRSFALETRTLRVFAVYDPADETAFLRGIGAVRLRDDVWFEGSAGLFAGSAPDTIGRLTDRDFLYARLKVFF